MRTRITKVQLSLIIAMVFVVGNIAFGQQWVGSSDTTGTIHRDGYVGIGTANPEYPLTIKSASKVGLQLLSDQFPILLLTSYAHESAGCPSTIQFYRSRGDSASPAPVLNGDKIARLNFKGYDDTWSTSADIDVLADGDHFSGSDDTDSPGRIEFRTTPDGSGSPETRMTIKSSGYIGIGTSTPQSLFAVNGEITAKEVTVTSTGWPDFVFEEDYPLMKIQEVEAYIQNNKRLPAIPAASEIEKDGVNLGEMQTKLLQKTEEMMLYIIKQQKEIDALKSELTALKSN